MRTVKNTWNTNRSPWRKTRNNWFNTFKTKNWTKSPASKKSLSSKCIPPTLYTINPPSNPKKKHFFINL